MSVRAKAIFKNYPDVLTAEQMCEALGIGIKTGYKLLRNNEIISVKVGRKYLVAKEHLINFFNFF
jgi:excisionase family DNA binding protein